MKEVDPVQVHILHVPRQQFGILLTVIGEPPPSFLAEAGATAVDTGTPFLPVKTNKECQLKENIFLLLLVTERCPQPQLTGRKRTIHLEDFP